MLKMSIVGLALLSLSSECLAFLPMKPSLTTTRRSSRSSSSSRTDPALISKEEPDKDQVLLDKTPLLCKERNLPLENVKNARDLASVRSSPIQPGRVFRMGRLGDATPQDLQVLFQDQHLKTLVDLRSPTELKDDAALMNPTVFGNFTNILWRENGRRNDGCLKILKDGESPVKQKSKAPQVTVTEETDTPTTTVVQEPPPTQPTIQLIYDPNLQDDEDDAAETQLQEIQLDDSVFCNLDCADPESTPAALFQSDETHERYFVSLMNELKYVKGTLSRVRKRDIARSILKSPGALFSKRAWNSLKKPFLRQINGGGLPMLNELLLKYGAPGIKYVLELCADREKHPIAFHCTAGKDRTGMIAAIILGLLKVDKEAIVEDYSMSANVYAEMNDHQAMVGALSQRNLDPKIFLGAPPQVMRDTLDAIEHNYGSVEDYCTWIGFGPEQQHKLKSALLDP